jgi:hypothetical protein
MVANILIAVGFFFFGVLSGLVAAAAAINDTKNVRNKEDRDKHYVVYEF